EEAKLTPEQKIFKLANEVNIAFEPAVAYAQQPKCTATVAVACHDPGVVKVFLRLREEANAAFKIARANPDTAAVSALTAVVRRVLAELQAELLKTKTGAIHDTSNRLAIA
ncbi:MAG: hypothetical protein GTN49_10805, partial [candidate division Zixibacteria bacterium]|nr:hypothetical protein [candidate division Zixibacteria bacterium]